MADADAPVRRSSGAARGRSGDGATGSAGHLSEAEIVRVARALVAEVGVDGLTMRRLSEELGVALGATYHHVATKTDLLLLIAKDLYSEVGATPLAPGPWDAQVRELMIRTADLVTAHPGMAAFMNGHIDELFPVELNQIMNQLLVDAGFGSDDIAIVMAAMLFYVSGMAAGGLAQTDAAVFAGTDIRELFIDGLDLVLDGVRSRLPARRRKQLRAR